MRLEERGEESEESPEHARKAQGAEGRGHNPRDPGGEARPTWDEPEARPGTSGLDRLPRSHPPQMSADVSLSRACL